MASSNSSPANDPSQGNGVPSSSTFSFKAPFPVAAASSAGATALKHRRVSLASPSSPRIVQPWSFRDEMGLDSQSSDGTSSAVTKERKKGKMRRMDSAILTPDAPAPISEKKPRKKWTQEETMMLVNGCQIVCIRFSYYYFLDRNLPSVIN